MLSIMAAQFAHYEDPKWKKSELVAVATPGPINPLKTTLGLSVIHSMPGAQCRVVRSHSTKPADALQAAHQDLTGATEQAVENPTPECRVQSCHNESHKLTSLFVPLPNKIETRVNADNLRVEPDDYPFPDLKDYLLCAVHHCSRLGYTGPRFSITPKNLKSALDNKARVTEAIAKKLERRHVAGPFKTPPIHPLHCSGPWGRYQKKTCLCT